MISKMKKITKKDLKGLKQIFPVLEKEEMRRCVGGSSGGYYGDDWFNHGFGSYDPYGNFHWYSGYTQDEFNNWEGTWYGGWVYGLGYVYPDVYIYGYQGDGGSDHYGYGYYDDGYYGEDDGSKRGDIIKTDWACMFNCMNYIDSSRSAQEYYESFIGQYRDIDPIQNGGLTAANRIKALEACGFSFEEVNTVFYGGGGGVVQLVIFDAGASGGRTHAGIITGKDENGDTIIYDPTLQKAHHVKFDDIATVYRVKK